MKFFRLTTIVLLGSLAFGLLLAACGGPPSPTPAASTQIKFKQLPHGFVGLIAGSEAFMGLSLDGTNLVAYICDGTPPEGKSTQEIIAPAKEITIAAWFNGQVLADAFDLTSTSGAPSGIRLTGKFVGDTVSGTIKLADNRELSFIATRASSEKAGLYRADEVAIDGEKWAAGTIVLNDGKLHGALTKGNTVKPFTNPVIGI